MLSDRRRQLLAAMGIQAWELRNPPPPAAPVAMEPPPSATSAAAAMTPTAVQWDVEPALDAGAPPAPVVDDRAARIAGMDWDQLEAEVGGCTACALHAGRTRTVFGVGDHRARWLIVGEAPGADEDRLGEPFVGRAGKLLDEMLKALGLERGEVYIANILKCRPPENRDPRPEEAACCWPFLERQIELLQPKIILAVGRIAAQTLLQTDAAVGKLRGRVFRLAGKGVPVVVSYHPAYLLRSPREKRKSWEDLQLACRTLDATPASERSAAE